MECKTYAVWAGAGGKNHQQWHEAIGMKWATDRRNNLTRVECGRTLSAISPFPHFPISPFPHFPISPFVP
jgi:hypothetical protein